MKSKQKILNLKIELFNLLNELDQDGVDLSFADSELLFQLQNDPAIEDDIQDECQ